MCTKKKLASASRHVSIRIKYFYPMSIPPRAVHDVLEGKEGLDLY
jgi:hypothetical protein